MMTHISAVLRSLALGGVLAMTVSAGEPPLIIALKPDKHPEAMLAERAELATLATAALGREVTVIVPLSSAVIIEGFLNGTVDLGYLSGTEMVTAINQQAAKLARAGSIKGKTTYESVWLVRADAPYAIGLVDLDDGVRLMCRMVGAVEAAEVTVAEAPAPFEITRGAVSLGEDLSLDARAALEARPLSPGEAAAEGEAVRLVTAAPEGHRLRWMTAQGLGTPLELDDHTVDHLGEEVVFDDGLVESRTALEPQVYTLLALAIDGAGSNRWRWIDVAIGTSAPLSAVGGHLLDLGEALVPGLYSVQVSEADDLRGLRFSDPQPVPDLLAEMALPCADPSTAFDPAWLIEGRCLRSDVIGLRLILDVQ
jgi:hypothetical protein